jgi:hypothetical protein
MRKRLKDFLFFNKELPKLLEMNDRELFGEFNIALRHVKIVDTIHHRQMSLIREPLVGHTDFYDLSCL